jgi:hypothetical protein
MHRRKNLTLVEVLRIDEIMKVIEKSEQEIEAGAVMSQNQAFLQARARIRPTTASPR